MADDVLGRLIAATRWPNIHRGPESFIISFKLSERNAIHGLVATANGFALSFAEFRHLSIAFLIEHEDENGTVHYFEYWTVGDRLHRPSGRPTFVHTTDIGYFERQWHWHGIEHRISGPALESGELILHDEETKPGFRVERYRWLLQQFRVDGKKRDHTLGPMWLVANNVVLHIALTTGLPASPDEITPALSFELIDVQWFSERQSNNLYPSQFIGNNFREFRPAGVLSGRVASSFSFIWAKPFLKYNDDHCSRWIYENLFNDINLFDGPFFPSELDEFVALEGLERTYQK